LGGVGDAVITHSAMKLKAKPSPRFLKIVSWSLLAFALLGLCRVLHDTRLAVTGVVVEGVVTGTEVKSTSSTTVRHSGESWAQYKRRRDRQRGGENYYATVRFHPANGGAARDFKTLCTFGHDIKAGDAVQVIHLPSDPGVVEIHSARQLWWPIGVGCIVTLATAGLGLWLRRLSRRLAGGVSQSVPAAAQLSLSTP
jgi:Protein of unknown function (DUF3592)